MFLKTKMAYIWHLLHIFVPQYTHFQVSCSSHIGKQLYSRNKQNCTKQTIIYKKAYIWKNCLGNPMFVKTEM